MSTPSKQTLPFLLLSLLQKRSALFLKNLVLNDPSPNSSQTSSVAEYDHQCEGAEIILAFFKNRKQSVMLKTFNQLKQHPSTRYGQSRSERPTYLQKKNTINTTKRTFNNTTLSDASPVRQLQGYNNPLHTTKRQDLDRSHLNTSNLNKSKVDMEKLLSRVRQANSRTQISYSFRQAPQANSQYQPSHRQKNNSTYNPYNRVEHLATPTAGYYSRIQEMQQQRYKTNPDPNLSQHNHNHLHTDSRQLTKKNSRRQFIISKFNEIENTLHILGKEKGRSRLSSQIMGEIHSIKERLRL